MDRPRQQQTKHLSLFLSIFSQSNRLHRMGRERRIYNPPGLPASLGPSALQAGLYLPRRILFSLPFLCQCVGRATRLIYLEQPHD